METWLEVWENGKCYGNTACQPVFEKCCANTRLSVSFHSFFDFSQTPTSNQSVINWLVIDIGWCYWMRNWWPLVFIAGKQNFCLWPVQYSSVALIVHHCHLIVHRLLISHWLLNTGLLTGCGKKKIKIVRFFGGELCGIAQSCIEQNISYPTPC